MIPEHRIFHAEIVLKVMLEMEYTAKLNVRAAIQHLKFVWAQKNVKVSPLRQKIRQKTETEYIAKLNVRAAIQHLKFVWAQKNVKVSPFQDF